MNNEEIQLKVTYDDKEEITCFPGTIVKNLIKKFNSVHYEEDKYLGALVNNRVVSMTYPIEVDSNIRLLTVADSHGWRIYRSSVAFLLSMAAHECFPDNRLEIRHSLGDCFYCTFDVPRDEHTTLSIMETLETYMKNLVAAKEHITRRKLCLEDALFHFAALDRKDKCDLLRFKNPQKVVVFQCGKFIDLAHGVLCDNTRYLTHFKLFPYKKGFILQFPEREYPLRIGKFTAQNHLFNIFKSYRKWSKAINLNNVGELNEMIVDGNVRQLIDIEEAYQEKKIADISDDINKRKEEVKWVLIAGPSSSGKTTFSYRLSTQLKVNGIQPVIISVDNYFTERDKAPRDEKGNFDFEHIEALDLPLLHDHLARLDKGEEIETPTFDFKSGVKKWLGNKICLKENEVAIIEGIHSLDPLMTEPLAPERKFRIYINALTQLNLDDNNRISTTDNRLLRRIIRDNRTRGYKAVNTIKMWPSVRAGEKRWIFPFQNCADIAFSSALNYELAVLKPFAEPLLSEVKPWHPQYGDAVRLQDILSTILAAPADSIPFRSIIREFIGNGILG